MTDSEKDSKEENKQIKHNWNCSRSLALISTGLFVYLCAINPGFNNTVITPLRNLIASYTQPENKKQGARQKSGLESRAILSQDYELGESPITATRESTLVNIAPYCIKSGDTLSEIAERNETQYNLEKTTEKIIELNNIIIGCSYRDMGSYGDFDRFAETYHVSRDKLEKMVNSIPESERNMMRLITDPNRIQAKQVILIPQFE